MLQEKSSDSHSGLRQTLKSRHLQMIALGGVIGAGLFVGSGIVVQQTGPAAVISFALTGALIVLVMRIATAGLPFCTPAAGGGADGRWGGGASASCPSPPA
jgi:GABA permease